MWPPERESPAPSGQDGRGAEGKVLDPQNSCSEHRTQDHRRADYARALVFSEFGRAGRALDQGGFEDREPWETPRPSPELRMLARRWPA